jgi:hypothetical protein
MKPTVQKDFDAQGNIYQRHGIFNNSKVKKNNLMNFSSPIVILFLITFSFSMAELYGQETTMADSAKVYQVTIEDGSTFIGNILSRDSVFLVMKTSSLPKIEIPVDKIKSITEINKSNFKDGVYWFTNPHATRYLFGPSAFNLQKGEGYFQNTYVFLNSFNIGVTNYFSIGGGIEFLSTFGTLTQGDFDPIVFVTPKVGFKITDKVHVGGGILLARVPGMDKTDNLGLCYGIGTYGTLDHNITAGLGWGFVGEEFSEKPIITISGMTRLSKKTGLITENWIVPDEGYYGVCSYGLRFFGEKMSIDLAFINNADIAKFLFIGIPYVDFVVKF